MPVRQESLFFSLCHKGKTGNKLKLQPITLAKQKDSPSQAARVGDIQLIQCVYYRVSQK